MTGNKLNIGSGQRRFDTAYGWINVDCVSRPGQVPDLICDVGREKLPYPNNSMEYVVLHQVLEHFGCGEATALLNECYRVLKPNGSLIITVPDLRALAQRWLVGQLTEQIYKTNIYGAYQGEEGDRHKWGYTYDSLRQYVKDSSPWSKVTSFDWRPVSGADIARDWYIIGMEAIK